MESAMQTSGDKGMFTLEQNLHSLVVNRTISQTTANLIIQHRGVFKALNSNTDKS